MTCTGASTRNIGLCVLFVGILVKGYNTPIVTGHVNNKYVIYKMKDNKMYFDPEKNMTVRGR